MILYDPTTQNLVDKPIKFRPNTCFIMTQMGMPVPQIIKEITKILRECLRVKKTTLINANSTVTGKDYLVKIWEMIVSVPLGVAIISEEMKITALQNVFYEIGLLQTLGKNSIIIKTKDAKIPSDFVRTGYIEFDPQNTRRKMALKSDFKNFLEHHFELAEYFKTIGENIESANKTAALDNYMRSYLINPQNQVKKIIKQLIDTESPNQIFINRARDLIKSN